MRAPNALKTSVKKHITPIFRQFFRWKAYLQTPNRQKANPRGKKQAKSEVSERKAAKNTIRKYTASEKPRQKSKADARKMDTG